MQLSIERRGERARQVVGKDVPDFGCPSAGRLGCLPVISALPGKAENHGMSITELGGKMGPKKHTHCFTRAGPAAARQAGRADGCLVKQEVCFFDPFCPKFDDAQTGTAISLP